MSKEPEEYEKHWKTEADRMEAQSFRSDLRSYLLVALAIVVAGGTWFYLLS